MIKISATILTLNEERRIATCLDSLRDIADEIIVVDSGSTDRTVEIARGKGCRVTTRRLDGFGAQRQYATSLTTHSYVLAIDADEILSPALRQSLIELKRGTPSHRGYAFTRLNFYCGYAVKHCGWYPDIQTRLFDKRYANWDLRDISERVIFRDSIRPELLQGDLLHNRCETPAEYNDTLRRQAELSAFRIASSDVTINPLKPTLKALKSFFCTLITRKGIFDGTVGLDISRQHYRATRHAYTRARQLKKANNK